ncbi:hypothetical protein MKW98_000574 [Papaver atlanticum]|uniref:Uncharacterized protein n=1 Tax=Papaver atlanticum TaxID=357466 RepID=A0AAD4S465_9MAGN|nr:hypothetical protein MKW98_000574 [Papaver atlanticum]
MGSFWSSLLFLLFLVLVSSSSSADNNDLFETWCKQHGKIYSSEEEKLQRFQVFEKNLAFVNEHNNMENSTYTLALNSFADLTNHEFKASRLGLSGSNGVPRNYSSFLGGTVGDIPASLDWREKGAVTPVKDQGSCGACWSFSATGAMEGINQIVTGSLVSLSEQELVDCDKSYNSGCNGGLMDYAYKWVVKNGGIDTEEDYPYQMGDRTCNKNKLERRVVTIDGFADIPANENEILKAVVTQPVSVGICGSDSAFQLYSKGIFSGPCSTSLDHAVLIVGYGSENGVDYWILKNSWGTSWGINGYMHMLRNGPSKEGVCGINKLASYPTKTSANPPTPPKPPGPTKCSLFTKCAAGETCCCGHTFLGVCLSWKCCPLEGAVCCKDGKHCCPQDYPICKTETNQCFKGTQGTGNSTFTKALEKRSSSGNFGDWSAFLEAWNF